jgi:hypothetical protein
LGQEGEPAVKRALLGCMAVLALVGSPIHNVRAQGGTSRILTQEEIRKFLPDRVPMETESIAVDPKTSAALEFPDKTRLAVAALDPAGLSNEMRQKYQFVIISETRLKLDRWNIPAGMCGVALDPDKGADAPTRALTLRDFLGSELDRLILKLDPGAPEAQVLLTPKGPNGFELRFGKYVVSGTQK